ncbi:MAG: hypothetical protein JXO22_02115 [Phycisphaerae bacterium]|nr:hypothetical protein [Phycisphaerae bacterium]
MSSLTDPERLDAYKTALSFWAVNCYVHWRERVARDFRRDYDMGMREFGRLMFEHINAGNVPDEVPETRERWRDEFDYHYDMRFDVPGWGRLYVETVLETGREPDDARITVVNVHPE